MKSGLPRVGDAYPNATRRLYGTVLDHRDCLAGLGVVVAYLVAKVLGIAS